MTFVVLARVPMLTPDDERLLREEVLVLSRHDSTGGGASRAAECMARWYGCKHVTLEHGPHSVSLFGPLSGPLAAFARWQELLFGVVVVPLDILALALLLRRKAYRGIRLVHVHDTWTAFSPMLLRWLSRRFSVCVTLHDCSLLTGGCVYPYSCDKHAARCGACPQRRARRRWWTRLDTTAASQWLKRACLGSARIRWIAPSGWLAGVATRSFVLAGRPVTVIPNAVEASPMPSRPKSRGTPLRIVFSATSLSDMRKGADIARRVFNSLDFPAEIHLVGSGAEEFARGLRVPCVPHGYLKDRSSLQSVLAEADVFFLPSRADNLPYGISEALSAGLPVVSTRVGGIPEMIEHGVNGLLCEPEDVAALVACLGRLRDASVASSLKAAALQASSRYGVEPFLGAHLADYRCLLEERARPPQVP